MTIYSKILLRALTCWIHKSKVVGFDKYALGCTISNAIFYCGLSRLVNLQILLDIELAVRYNCVVERNDVHRRIVRK